MDILTFCKVNIRNERQTGKWNGSNGKPPMSMAPSTSPCWDSFPPASKLYSLSMVHVIQTELEMLRSPRRKRHKTRHHCYSQLAHCNKGMKLSQAIPEAHKTQTQCDTEVEKSLPGLG